MLTMIETPSAPNDDDKFPFPYDHEYGYTEKFLGSLLSHNDMNDFLEWMNGKGVILHNGSPVYFGEDVKEWMGGR